MTDALTAAKLKAEGASTEKMLQVAAPQGWKMRDAKRHMKRVYYAEHMGWLRKRCGWATLPACALIELAAVVIWLIAWDLLVAALFANETREFACRLGSAILVYLATEYYLSTVRWRPQARWFERDLQPGGGYLDDNNQWKRVPAFVQTAVNRFRLFFPTAPVSIHIHGKDPVLTSIVDGREVCIGVYEGNEFLTPARHKPPPS